jgi:hypothetical protein
MKTLLMLALFAPIIVLTWREPVARTVRRRTR